MFSNSIIHALRARVYNTRAYRIIGYSYLKQQNYSMFCFNEKPKDRLNSHNMSQFPGFFSPLRFSMGCLAPLVHRSNDRKMFVPCSSYRAPLPWPGMWQEGFLVSVSEYPLVLQKYCWNKGVQACLGENDCHPVHHSSRLGYLIKYGTTPEQEQ